MEDKILYNSFLEEIGKKIPQKTEVANIISEILCIDKNDVYRKLNGEASFTFYEVVAISRHLDISLDNLKIDDSSTAKQFEPKQIEYVNPAESDFALMAEMTTIMKSFKDASDPEAAEITNILPQPLYIPYENVSRFYLFKWKYQSNLNKAIPYKDIIISDTLKKTQDDYIKWARLLHADYIFDHLLFQYLIADIRYFYHAGLITREEILLIKQDLLYILDDIDYLTNTGFFRETGKRVNIYISDVNIDTNYVYVSTPDFQLTIIKAFIINGIATTDKKISRELSHRVQSIKQQSILITGSSEKDRIKFLTEQRNVIESLSLL